MGGEEEPLLEGNGKPLRRRSVALLCIYSFCLHFTPYLVPFLTTVRGFSNSQVTNKIFPVSVYSTLVFTLVAAPACTLLTYRGFILIGALGRLSTFFILLWGKSLLSMQAMQVTYALGVASDLVFSSYLFVLAKEDMYQSLTSFTQASSTFSFLVAAELSRVQRGASNSGNSSSVLVVLAGQLLVVEGVNLTALLYISSSMVALAAVLCVFFPVEKRRWITVSNLETDVELDSVSGFQKVLQLVKATWSNPSLQFLSFWWAFQLGGMSMIENYATNLFDAVDPTSIYNGHVIAAAQAASCVAALAAVPASRYLMSTSKSAGIYVMASIVTSILCNPLAFSRHLWLVYAAYILCVAVNKFFLCILYVQCARLLSHGHFVPLFSLNAVAALLVQSCLQAYVEIVSVNVSRHFLYIGLYFMMLGGASSVLLKCLNVSLA